MTVLAETPSEQAGMAVPRTSRRAQQRRPGRRLRACGAERFEPRPVRIEPLDGQRVLIAAGLAAGKRVVVQGAELLDQIR